MSPPNDHFQSRIYTAMLGKGVTSDKKWTASIGMAAHMGPMKSGLADRTDRRCPYLVFHDFQPKPLDALPAGFKNMVAGVTIGIAMTVTGKLFWATRSAKRGRAGGKVVVQRPRQCYTFRFTFGYK